jgi:hydroxylamine dehydrogenase
LTEIEFDEEIEFTYFLLWHHEGRRVRHGVAMMGPDYTQWHGFFEIAERFYTEFVPQLKDVIRQGRSSGNAAEAAHLEYRLNEILTSDMHKWSLGKLSAEEQAARKQAAEEFKKRYAQ